MEASHRHASPSPAPYTRSCASQALISDDYFIYSAEYAVVVRDLNDSLNRELITADDQVRICAIAICARGGLLAFSRGSQIHIYDVTTCQSKAVICESARTIIALTWSLDGTTLAGGGVDGAVCVWSWDSDIRLVHRCRSGLSPVRSISWSSYASGTLAIVKDEGLYLWQLDKSAQLIVEFKEASQRLLHILWSMKHPCSLLASTQEGRICVWDFTRTLQRGKAPKSTASLVSLVSQKKLYKDIIYLAWTAEHTATFLFNNGRRFASVDLRAASFGRVDWELGFSHAFEAFVIEDDGNVVRMLSQSRERRYTLPGRRSESQSAARSMSAGTHQRPADKTAVKDSSRGTMSSVSIQELQRMQSSLAQLRDYSSSHEKSSETAISPRSNHKSLLTAHVTQNLEHDDGMSIESSSLSALLSPEDSADTPTTRIQHKDKESATEQHEGYFGSFSSTNVNDSDSDDDTFDIKASKDSTQFRAGPINVPLPRTCGALFSANGSLVMFRPPQQKPAVARDALLLEQIETDTGDLERTARLFPRFGNLLADIEMLEQLPVDGEPPSHAAFANLGVDKASHDSGPLWRSHPLPTARESQPVNGATVVECTVQLAPGTSELAIAQAYRMLTREGQTASDLCLTNAKIASQQDWTIDCVIWQTLSKVLGEADARSRHQLEWADHPFGAAWLVRRLYALAEKHCLLHMLAYITACVISTDNAETDKLLGSMHSRLAASRKHTTENEQVETALTAQTIVAKSQARRYGGSAISSRNPSTPTTPHLDSASSTPPWNFTIPQPSPRVSVSTSASPEHTRGSFSAAVKSYAQSVSDKFTAYGTSPPIRKGWSTPGNEVVSSLSSTGGSWSKSVSFALTTTSRTSTLSLVPSEVDNGYDSDRTIEDAVAIHNTTPDSAKPKITWKNKASFSHCSAGSAYVSLLPHDMLPHCSIWVSAYAERLRCHGLSLQAVQFDKIGAVISRLDGIEQAQQHDQPHISSTGTNTSICGVCWCIVEGLKQRCPQCQQSFHSACYDGAVLLSERGCPNGCQDHGTLVIP